MHISDCNIRTRPAESKPFHGKMFAGLTFFCYSGALFGAYIKVIGHL